ncbi:MAG: universal stress protein [Thermoleophilia bacterium]
MVGVDGSRARDERSPSRSRRRWCARAVVVVHAYAVPACDYGPLGVNTPADPGLFEDAAAGLVDAAVAEARERGATDVEGRWIEADAAPALVEQAGEGDLLVVGSRGRGGFPGLRLGSVGWRCVQHARCPIALVPLDGSP